MANGGVRVGAGRKASGVPQAKALALRLSEDERGWVASQAARYEVSESEAVKQLIAAQRHREVTMDGFAAVVPGFVIGIGATAELAEAEGREYCETMGPGTGWDASEIETVAITAEQRDRIVDGDSTWPQV